MWPISIFTRKCTIIYFTWSVPVKNGVSAIFQVEFAVSFTQTKNDIWGKRRSKFYIIVRIDKLFSLGTEYDFSCFFSYYKKAKRFIPKLKLIINILKGEVFYIWFWFFNVFVNIMCFKSISFSIYYFDEELIFVQNLIYDSKFWDNQILRVYKVNFIIIWKVVVYIYDYSGLINFFPRTLVT